MSTATAPEVVALLQKSFAGFLGMNPADIKPDRSIRELGLDSLSAMELLIHIEESMGVSLFLEDFTGRETIAELAAAYLKEHGT
jgi:acyl carrier protein